MPYVICAPCVDVMDKACVDGCPVSGIHEAEDTNLPEGERRNMLYINPDECIECGACAPECPVEAIFEVDDVPEEWKEYIEINANAFA